MGIVMGDGTRVFLACLFTVSCSPLFYCAIWECARCAFIVGSCSIIFLKFCSAVGNGCMSAHTLTAGSLMSG